MKLDLQGILIADDHRSTYPLLLKQLGRDMSIYKDELPWSRIIDRDHLEMKLGLFKGGTIIIDPELPIFAEDAMAIISEETPLISFVLNDLTQSYMFRLFEDGKQVRSKWSVGGEIDKSMSFGVPLKEELKYPDTADAMRRVIFDLFESYAGIHFSELSEDQMFKVYELPTSNIFKLAFGMARKQSEAFVNDEDADPFGQITQLPENVS